MSAEKDLTEEQRQCFAIVKQYGIYEAWNAHMRAELQKPLEGKDATSSLQIFGMNKKVQKHLEWQDDVKSGQDVNARALGQIVDWFEQLDQVKKRRACASAVFIFDGILAWDERGELGSAQYVAALLQLSRAVDSDEVLKKNWDALNAVIAQFPMPSGVVPLPYPEFLRPAQPAPAPVAPAAPEVQAQPKPVPVETPAASPAPSPEPAAPELAKVATSSNQTYPPEVDVIRERWGLPIRFTQNQLDDQMTKFFGESPTDAFLEKKKDEYMQLLPYAVAA